MRRSWPTLIHFKFKIVLTLMEYNGIIIGLGNPGSKYVGTRHNMGFALIDYMLDIAQREGQCETLVGTKFKCDLWRCKFFSSPKWWLLAKPLTYMNLSGESAQPLLAWHKLQAEQLLVLHDELDIPIGELRFKSGGGNAGHNGLKSISQHLGTPDFHRLRIGIGRPPHAAYDVSNWVLGNTTQEENILLKNCMHNALKVIDIFFSEGSKSASKQALSMKPTLNI